MGFLRCERESLPARSTSCQSRIPQPPSRFARAASVWQFPLWQWSVQETACVAGVQSEVKRDRRIDEVPDTPEECVLPEGSRGRACSHKWCKVRAWQFLSEGARRLEDESEEKGGELTYDGVRRLGEAHFRQVLRGEFWDR